MGSLDYSASLNVEGGRRQKVAVPPPMPFFKSAQAALKETLFPDDPLRQFRQAHGRRRRLLAGLQYFFPFLEWAPRYDVASFKGDLLAGITVASLAIPQGISYAKLAGLPPILGLYSSFVPPLVYAMLGSSRDLAIGTVAVGSLLLASMLGQQVNALENPQLYLRLALTATFVAGILQAALGFLRLGFIVDFLSHATIVGFMGGAATVVCLQQLKPVLGLEHFTHATDIVSVLRSVFTQTHQWKWESAVLGCSFLFYLLLTRYLGKKSTKFFWVAAMAPLTSVVLGSLLVYFTHAEKHGVQIIGELKRGLNPPSFSDLAFGSPYLSTALRTGLVTGIIILAEGVAAGRSFAMLKNYNIDGNKEMIAFGMMNILGSCTSCYLTTGPFSRSAVNYNAGCKTAASNIVLAASVMVTLLFLTPLFHYTPLVVLGSIIISAALGLIDYEAVIHLWTLDKFDFFVCISAYLGVVFGNIEIGLVVAIGLSIMRVLLFVVRPRTMVLGNLPESRCYRGVDQYPAAQRVPGLLIIEIGAPIYFTNAGYIRERIMRWIDEEEDKLKAIGQDKVQYLILDLGGVSCMDTSGISMFDEVKKIIDRREIKLVFANPSGEVMKKLDRSRFLESLGQESVFLTVEEAVGSCCNFMMYETGKVRPEAEDSV